MKITVNLCKLMGYKWVFDWFSPSEGPLTYVLDAKRLADKTMYFLIKWRKVKIS